MDLPKADSRNRIAPYDPDDLSPEEIAQSRESIRRGLESAAAGRGTPLKAWAAQIRHDFDLPLSPANQSPS